MRAIGVGRGGLVAALLGRFGRAASVRAGRAGPDGNFQTGPRAATGLLPDKNTEPADRERWTEALSAHPKLIQRPIITADDGSAVVGRSEEAVRDALGRG